MSLADGFRVQSVEKKVRGVGLAHFQTVAGYVRAIGKLEGVSDEEIAHPWANRKDDMGRVVLKARPDGTLYVPSITRPGAGILASAMVNDALNDQLSKFTALIGTLPEEQKAAYDEFVASLPARGNEATKLQRLEAMTALTVAETAAKKAITTVAETAPVEAKK